MDGHSKSRRGNQLMPRYSSRSWRAFRPQQAPAALSLEARDCRVLGLDPGSLRTGFGIIDCRAGTESHVASGCIDVAGADMVVRLQRIHARVSALVSEYRPDMVAIERVFLHRNPDSALKLGQARGVALCAAASQGASVHEYAPRAIKMAVTGYGAAAKPQVAQMVRTLLALEASLKADAADALAAALCHSQTRRLGGLKGALLAAGAAALRP
jgi:crossover junction endodeoxyribonuclease RuvC